MDKKSGFSQIPKLTYSLKRSQPATTETSSIPTREATQPSNNSRYIIKSAPNSKQGSPVMGRSKSLRLPRKPSSLRSSSAPRLDSNGQKSSQVASDDKGMAKDSSSSPGSSRANSPTCSYVTAMDHTDFVSSTEVSGTDSDLSRSGNTGNDNPFLRRRTQSFGPLVRGRRNIARPLHRSQLRPPVTSSRDTTPTPAGQRSTTPSSLQAPSLLVVRRPKGGSLTPSGHRQVRSRSSLGTNTPTVNEDGTNRPSEGSIKMRRADSSNSLTGGNQSSGRGVNKRHGTYMPREAADLNQLAQEISSSMEEGGLHTPEFKSVSRLQSSARHKQLTSSMPSSKVGVASGDHTPSSTSSAYPRGKLNSKTRSASSEKLHAPHSRGSRQSFSMYQTPDSSGGTSNGKTGRNRSSSLIGGGPLEEGKLSKNPRSRGTVNSRSSTPSSGRSTPVGGIHADKKVRDPKLSPTLETPPAGVPNRLPRTGIRSTQRRVVKVREARPVGINELEGAVLIDADEYLKILHEVKALKTAVLKLKRELQTDTHSVSGNGSTSTADKTPSRRTSSNSHSLSMTDLTKKIDQLTMEKTKAEDEANRHKKDLQKFSEKLDKSNFDLKRAEEMKSSLKEQFQHVEGHRDRLLDKVERLHADKHKLEDRLSSMEKAQFYEESSTWVEGGEGGVGEWEETLMLDGGKGEKTESDMGENSEPESAAVCGGPHS